MLNSRLAAVHQAQIVTLSTDILCGTPRAEAFPRTTTSSGPDSRIHVAARLQACHELHERAAFQTWSRFLVLTRAGCRGRCQTRALNDYAFRRHDRRWRNAAAARPRRMVMAQCMERAARRTSVAAQRRPGLRGERGSVTYETDIWRLPFCPRPPGIGHSYCVPTSARQSSGLPCAG
jgi:hypothetical protein